MNRKIISSLLVAALLVTAWSCRKDSDVFIPNSPVPGGPDTTWVNTVEPGMPVNTIKKNLFPELALDSIEVNASPVSVTTPSGLKCSFPAFCCVGSNGQPVTGKVYVELLLIKAKGDMIRADKPTTSNGRLLLSGGEMFVRLTKNGQELQLAQGKTITLRYNDSPIVPGMKVFYGDESNPNQFNWLPGDSISAPPVFAGNNFYELTSRSLRWINCDQFIDTNGVARVQVGASLAPQYTNANTLVYLVFNNMRTVVGMYGNAATRKFMSGKVPVGMPATVVVISKLGDDYYLGHEGFVTNPQPTAPAGQQLIPVNPLKKSLADVKAYLATL